MSYWWEHEDAIEGEMTLHQELYNYVRGVEENQRSISQLNLFNAKLYSNRDLMAISWDMSNPVYNFKPASHTLENIIGNVVDAVTALIGRHKPKVTPVVRDADFAVERQARGMGRFLWAEFNYQDVWRKMQRGFNDCLWAQIGAIKVDIDGDEIYTERVMPDEIIVDQRECIGSNVPLQVHQRKLMTKMQLAAMFPKRAKEIFDISSQRKTSWTKQRGPTAESCVVVESWFPAKKGIPGRHALVTEGLTLIDEPYTRTKAPFIFLRWAELPTGFYSQSLVEQLTPYQLRHNVISEVIALAQDIICRPRIAVEGNSKVIKSHIDDAIGRILHYRGVAPHTLDWKTNVQELYAERDRNQQKAFQFVGMPQTFATGTVEQGNRLDSAKANREQSHREQERFAVASQNLELAYLEIGEHYVELNTILAKRGVFRKLKWKDKSLVQQIDWENMDLVEDRYVLELRASSVLNMEPAAREDILSGWQANGRIDGATANGLSGNPDLEEEESLMRAGMDDIKATVESLDDGDFPQPDPLQNLVFGIPYIHKTYLKRMRQIGVPEAILQNYRDWIVEAKVLLEGEETQANQGAFQPTNMGPDGQILPAIATTSQGSPVAGLLQ